MTTEQEEQMKIGFYFTMDEKGWLDKKQYETVSLSPLNALEKAAGNYCWVILYPEKTFLTGFNAETILRRFAKDCALDAIKLWEAPEVVKEYLKSDTEELRNAARDAARDAAWNTIWDAARSAAWNAARDAARDAARNAARDAAWDAARGAAINATGAAWDAAWDDVLEKYDGKLKLALQQKVTDEEKADCKS